MNVRDKHGLTLVELLIASAIIGILAAGAAGLLSVCLQAHAIGTQKSAVVREGVLAMERMTSGVRLSSFLLVPNAHDTNRPLLAFSGTVNDDNDFYFGDALFPRIDEDPGQDMANSNDPGIASLDDDGDAATDEGAVEDDDEDGTSDEDPVDGIDADADGNIDEDAGDDLNGDGQPGIATQDDDGDGATDEGATEDDDEDGTSDEDPLNTLVYAFDGINTLKETRTWDGAETVLSNNVTSFTITYETADATHNPRVLIALTLDNNGEALTFEEYAYPRNIMQIRGRRVR